MVLMFKKQNNDPERKYAWADKWVKMTGGRARIDAKVNDLYYIRQRWCARKGIP